ncbi:MAG: GMC family oxidoreductase N-terminal domain-containing protein [Thermoleophilia bacterium]
MSEHFDVVVVGAGAGGGVAASRLSDDPARRVLLLEAGPDFPEEAEFPPGFVSGGHQFMYQYAAEHDWGYWSEPLYGERPIRLPRGRLVGGSTMTNAQMWVRAAPYDFDRWQANGAPSWSYDFADEHYRAVEREVYSRTYPRDTWQPAQLAYFDALRELGFRECEDMNAPDAWRGTIGATPINRRNEMRQGTLVTYVRKARPRANFEVRGGHTVDRVLLDGTRATGVRAIGPDGRAHDIAADVVVLAGGAYGSPAILMRSGIGPADHLRSLGIDVANELPVGDRLLDHAAFYWFLRAPELARMKGPSVAMFARCPDNDWFSLATTVDEVEGTIGLVFATCGDNESGAPFRLRSTDPLAPPIIPHRYDVEPLRSAERLVEQVLALPLFRDAENLDAGRSLEELARERIGTCYHVCGTTAIGQVVDEQLRVLGCENLLVADASVFPTEISNNTNMTSFMVGEVAARVLGAPAPA